MTMNGKLSLSFGVALLALGVWGCSRSSQVTSTPEVGTPLPGLALVRSVDIASTTEQSDQVQVVARGQHPDGCTRI